ncbi:MAG: multiheme c-type cytochrome [Sulfurimonas sp.]|uniref:multiheme c-type cytochrome n=1 Tax=Sulfurimonas sp. TaxID=2022749 RepID=UPI0026340AEB|nr:multiheme c-type cytochrome [Sulfurimonas sp.]MDD2652956.1 multiheme c-type cytochrome [Sulfurimonas sp.]MDD3452402.1 multiheme c-type cytochrome [Sulfurimonas sp.]
MKKMLFLAAVLSSLLFAQSETETCKKCHPQIVDEFEGSMHASSTYYKDPIHKGAWDLHPLKEKGDYNCKECHAPLAKNEDEIKNGVTCASCHTIKDVEEHAAKNKNIYGSDPKTFYSAEAGREKEKVVYKKESSWFGMSTTSVGSPYHNIDYTNEKFYNGQMCMGCHSHRQNAAQLTVCETGKEGVQKKEENCITCHMPIVQGTATTIRQSQDHAYHGFAGTHKNPEMLSKYVDIELNKRSSGFDVVINNKAPHNLMLHPMRVVELRVNLINGSKATSLMSHSFVRALGNENGPSMPWLANQIVTDTMIKANEKKIISYTDALKKGDKVEVQLGYYIVTSKTAEKLNIAEHKELQKFNILKQKSFIVE